MLQRSSKEYQRQMMLLEYETMRSRIPSGMIVVPLVENFKEWHGMMFVDDEESVYHRAILRFIIDCNQLSLTFLKVGGRNVYNPRYVDEDNMLIIDEGEKCEDVLALLLYLKDCFCLRRNEVEDVEAAAAMVSDSIVSASEDERNYFFKSKGHSLAEKEKIKSILPFDHRDEIAENISRFFKRDPPKSQAQDRRI